MFTSGQYREKAVEYGKLVKTASGPNERREFQDLEQRFVRLAENEQWLTDNYDKTLREVVSDTEAVTLVEEEGHILRCLGAALGTPCQESYGGNSSITQAPWANC